jgi:hypothetical protein
MDLKIKRQKCRFFVWPLQRISGSMRSGKIEEFLEESASIPSKGTLSQPTLWYFWSAYLKGMLYTSPEIRLSPRSSLRGL